MQALLADLEEVTSGAMATEKQFSFLTTTYEWIASKLQNYESDVLKEELKKELTNMGTQLCSLKRDLQTWRSTHSKIDDTLLALRLHVENLACLMKGLN